MSLYVDFSSASAEPLLWNYGTTEGGRENVGNLSVLGIHSWQTDIYTITFQDGEDVTTRWQGYNGLRVYNGDIGFKDRFNTNIDISGFFSFGLRIESSTYNSETGVHVWNVRTVWMQEFADRISYIQHEGIANIFDTESGLTYGDLQTDNFNDLLREGVTVIGSNSTNFLRLSDNGENIIGGFVGDFIDGRGGNDRIEGGGGNDVLVGGDGQDTLLGGGNDDRLIGGTGADFMDGGAGDDDYYVDDPGDRVFNALGQGGTDTVYASVDWTENEEANGSVQILRADAGNRGLRLVGNRVSDQTIIGGGGNDILIGGEGRDTLDGKAGADQLFGGGGVDTVSYETSPTGLVLDLSGFGSTGDAAGDTFDGFEIFGLTSFADTFGGGSAGDVITLGSGNDAASGNGGDDALYGEEGDDLLRGNAGNDVLHGGTGNDTVRFDDATLGVSIDLQIGLAVGFGSSNAGTDTLTDIENARGSAFNDVLRGSTGTNVLEGGGGTDLLIGGNGADALIGGSGVDTASYETSSTGIVLALGGAGSTGDAAGDTFDGIEIYRLTSFADTFGGGSLGDVVALSAGNDAASGNAGDDALYGAEGDDLLRGNAGNDVLHGGTGTDTVSYDDATLGVSVDLQNGLAAGFGSSNAGTDTLFDIENVRGSAFNDVLRGSTGANLLVGGGGIDSLFGGAGGDTFLYRVASDSTLTVADVIRDFQLGVDKVDLRLVHTQPSDTFNITSNANGSYLSVDQGGNGSLDMLIQIATQNVTSADILWA